MLMGVCPTDRGMACRRVAHGEMRISMAQDLPQEERWRRAPLRLRSGRSGRAAGRVGVAC